MGRRPAGDPLRHDRHPAGLARGALRELSGGRGRHRAGAGADRSCGRDRSRWCRAFRPRTTRMPDVMRGEETQIFGALALSGSDAGLFLLPGTHSKWAEVVRRPHRVVPHLHDRRGVRRAQGPHDPRPPDARGRGRCGWLRARRARRRSARQRRRAAQSHLRDAHLRPDGQARRYRALRLSQRPADRRRGRGGDAADDERRHDHREPRAGATLHRCAAAARPRQHARAGRIASRPVTGASRAPPDLC